MSKSKANISVCTKARADRINAAWRQSATQIIEAGRLLLEAKDALPHGDFERMIKRELDFVPQTARKLMAIASDQRILNRAHGRALPDHWTTLYELTQLDDAALEQAFETGIINKTMQRSEAKRLRAPEKPTVTDAEFHDVRESPPAPSPSPIEGGAVLAEGNDVSPIGVNAEMAPPLDDPKGEDRDHHPIVSPPEDWESVTFANGDPLRFANGVLLIMEAFKRGLSPEDAARQWPEDVPLLSEALRDTVNFMIEFERAFGEEYGAGNPLALQMAAE
jgi:hypothetical protein